MLSPKQNRAGVEWLEAHSRRPLKAMRLWSLLFTDIDRETGEVLLTREQMAELTGIAVQHISNIMAELESIGAIMRRRERVDGMRGPGRVRYYMNPMVATHLGGGARDQAQAVAPLGPLRLLSGGKAPL